MKSEENKNGEQQQLADIRWNEEEQPICQRFDDVYFSTDEGLEETRHNFIYPNQLAERFRSLSEHDLFRVAETGFGTGLSFLACWQAWQESGSLGQLEFYSVEKYPLNRKQLHKALKQWPELAELTEALYQAYPLLPANGWHCLEFGSCRLQLFIGDVLDGLRDMYRTAYPRFLEHNRQIDAWFLDGFMPSKNPDMWRPEVLRAVAQLSNNDSTLSTFTAASAVRKGLLELGFDIKKASGFGLKREMLYGTFTAAEQEEKSWPTSAFNSSDDAPWDLNLPPTSKQPKDVCIIGGGIAASCSARALANAGFSVIILERHKALAQEGSGNPQGVLYAKLSHRAETLSQFNLHCLLYAQRFYRNLLDNAEFENSGFEADLCGVVQLAQSEKHFTQQGLLVEHLKQFGSTDDFVQRLSAEDLSTLTGVHMDKPGLYFPAAGWLNPASACRALCQHPNIKVRYEQEVDGIRKVDEQWQCLDASEQVIQSSDLLIIANANDARHFEQTQQLPLKPVRGQVSYFDATAASQALQTVVCGRGYIAPARNGEHCLGASFNLHEQSLDLRIEEQSSNVQHLQDDCPSLHNALNLSELNAEDPTELRGRVALRCTSPDYLPLLGPVPDMSAMRERFALLSRNAKATIPLPGCYHNGLYISVAYGSRGLCYAPLAAAELLSQIQQGPSPLGAKIRKALNPARFTIRDMIRRKTTNTAVKA